MQNNSIKTIEEAQEAPKKWGITLHVMLTSSLFG